MATILQSNIVMAKVHFSLLTLNQQLNMILLVELLWVWNGLFTNKSVNPQYSLTKVNNLDTYI
jgi:hypothetical protein